MAKDAGLCVNAAKTKFIAYKEQGSILPVKGEPLNKTKNFTYLGSEIASTEKCV